MALIKCAECGNEVSEKAEKCPKCACPIAQGRIENVKTVELTSKNLKKWQLICTAIFMVGLISWFSGATWGPFVFFVGAVSLFIVKTQIWWHHK